MTIAENNLEKFKELLLADKERLEYKISALKNMDFGSSPGLDNEEADETEEMSNNLATIGTLQGRLDNINLALDKIDSNTYGICEVCGTQISQELLEVNPESSTCRNCK